ncbi:MAG: PP2C family serine/threonine-protein phosphatase [Actinomycetota bacterium]
MTENNFQMYSAAVSDRGLSEKRPQNEDSFLEMRNLGLFAVADGVGGAQAGDVASQMAVEILGEAFINLKANGDAEEMMKIAIERANSAIYQMSTDLPQLSTMATTIVTLHLSGNIATIGHVGDSRLYRLDGRGSLYRETQDHSVVEEEVRAGRMTAEQAANHPSRNVISRALGAENTVEVDMKTIMFEPNTTFLLCSDGITRHIKDFEIRELLIESMNPAEICQKMKEICYSRGAEDNLTAVIIKVVGTEAGNEYTNMVTVAPILDEEATIATPRQEIAEKPLADDEENNLEIPTRGLEMPVSMQTPSPTKDISGSIVSQDSLVNDDEAYLMEEPSPVFSETVPEVAELPNTMSFSANDITEAPLIVLPQTIQPEKQYKTYEAKEKSGGFFGKLLSSLLLLLVGAILGIAGYYFWQVSVADKPVKPELSPQTNNIPKNSTDNLRYDAETKPEKVIKQYDTAAPKDASDFYILGKAFLKLKNYEEAKRQFILARNNLKEVKDPQTKAILDADITEGLVFSQDKAAQAAFEREAKSSPLVETDNQTNTNLPTNSSSGTSPANQ